MGWGWWWMNYSAFSLSFCISLSAFWWSGTCRRGGEWIRGGRGCDTLHTHPCHCSAWRDRAGFKATCAPVILHISAPSAIRSVSSPSVSAWQAHAPSTLPPAMPPQPLWWPSSLLPLIPEQEAWVRNALVFRRQPLLWYAGFKDAWWVSPVLPSLWFCNEESLFSIMHWKYILPHSVLYLKWAGRSWGWQKCDWEVA